MIPLIKSIAHAFLWDELAFTRWARGTMLGVSACGVAFADSLAAIVGDGSPGLIKTIKVASVVCGFLAGAITAGQRNPA